MLPERLILLATAQGLEFTDVPGGAIPEWTVTDLALAMEGLETLYFQAFAFRWAADYSGLKPLRDELLRETRKLAEREKWPGQLENRPYRDELVDMCFLEEQHPHVFRVSVLWPALMDCSMELWRKELSSKYEAVRMIFEGWVCVAHHHMLDRLIQCEELAAA